MLRRILCILMAVMSFCVVNAQMRNDTVTAGIKRDMRRNFSQSRPVNISWEISPEHDYTFDNDDGIVERGRMADKQNIRLNAMMPFYSKGSLVLIAKGEFDFYRFRMVDCTRETPVIYDADKGFSYFKASLDATYRTTLLKKPLILNASIGCDGWHRGLEEYSGVLTAIMMLKQTRTSSVTVGLMATTLFNRIPVLPFVAWSYMFDDKWCLDLSIGGAYIRCIMKERNRLSLGASIGGEGYYVRTQADGIPSSCYYQKAVLKPELVYEYIIDNRLFFVARGGVATVLKSGLYDKDRGGFGADAYVDFDTPVTPFLQLGVSYSFF